MARQEYAVFVPGKPTGKGRPRFTRQGRTYTPEATVTAEAWVQMCTHQAVGQLMLDGALEVELEATFEVPASWSLKKRVDALFGAIRPTGKPDLDNIAKLYTDAMTGIVWHDDAAIVRMVLTKAYGSHPGVLVRVRPVDA